jgi:deazaflavin-dependent oxidoreductase (nitroreductase family)
MSDNTFIDNLVDGQIEAARHLVPGSPLGGQAYFITDGVPINYFEFFRPIVEGLGFEHPKRRIPAAPLLAFVTVWEFLHATIKIPRPMLTPMELRKIVVSHYNRIDKARRDFGWVPKVSMDDAMARCLEHCRELLAKREGVDRPHWGWWASILGGMTLLGTLTLSPEAHALWSRSVTSWTPRWLLAGVFVWALLLHVYKGMKAVRVAERAGLQRTSMGWGWQTFALGFASLRMLEMRIETRADGGIDLDGAKALRPPRAGWAFPNIRWLLSLITKGHRFIYRATGGLLGPKFMGMRFLLLVQQGRRSGRERVTPLLYVDHDGRWIVVASNAGDDRAPAWWLNLKSRPAARIQVGRRRLAVAARRATAEECARLWPKLNGAHRHFDAYQRRTSRDIPVVILEPAG